MRAASIITWVVLVSGSIAILGLQRLCAEEWEGRNVVELRHQPEDPQTAINPAQLAEMLPQKPGHPYSAQLIRESIQQLYRTGRFTNISVDAAADGPGVVLTFITRNAYFVDLVRVLGVEAPPGEPQLRSASGLEFGHLFTDEGLAAATSGIERVLQDDGYLRPKIVPSLHRLVESQRIEITFQVTTGARAKLRKVNFSGSTIFPPARLVHESGWKTGKPLTFLDLQDGLNGIRKYYQKHQYLEAAVSMADKKFDEGSNTIDLDVAVNPGAMIDVSVSGASVSRSTMKRLLPVFLEGSTDEQVLADGDQDLADYFQSQGYYGVAVTHEVRAPAPGRIEVEYEIVPGPRERLTALRIGGNHYFNGDAIREQLKTQPSSFWFPYGRYSAKLLEGDLSTLRVLYQNNGFPDVYVGSKIEPLEPKGSIAVSIEIREGAQKRIGDFSMTGNVSFSAEQLQRIINAAQGQPYSESIVTTDRDNIQSYYFNEGFPEVKFSARAAPPDDHNRVNLEYVIDEGRRQYVQHVYVSGLENTRPGVVNRQVSLQENMPLSQDELTGTQRRLYDLGIFRQVTVAVQNPAGEEDRKNVMIRLEETRRYILKLGLGAEIGRFGGSSNEVTNVQGASEFSPDVSFDLTRLDFGGRPHFATLSARFSSLQKRAGLSYTAPEFLNRPELTATAVGYFDESRDVRTFTSQTKQGSLQLQRKAGKITTFVYRYSISRVAVDTDTLRISPQLFPILTPPIFVGMLDQTVIRDTRDNPADSRSGMYTSLDMGIAAKALGSQTSFGRVLLQNSSYYGIGKKLVFARYTEFGFQLPFGQTRTVVIPSTGTQPEQVVQTNVIPIAESFFVGSGNGHRGFAVNQAGPRDPETGFPLGGNAVLLNTLELRFPIWRTAIGGVLFDDIGNVFADLSHIDLRIHQKNLQDFAYLSNAAGFGLRYGTPVGPIRMDLGYNLNPTRFQLSGSPYGQSLSRWQFVFSIGQTF